MSYFTDVYKKRGKWWGETSKNQYLNISKKYFQDYLMSSPNSGQILLNNIEIPAVILDNKDDENKISKFFLFDLEVNVAQGDLVYWYDDYWLVLQKEKRSFEAYNKILAVRCNHTLKWIDNFGVLNETPAYIFGHMKSAVADNFIMASGLLVSPQANKNLQVLIPYYPIKSEQRFIIHGEAWRVLERDLVSVNGILYLYLIEDLIDSFNDNATLDIADYEKLNSGYIEIGLETLVLGIGESFTFNPILYKNDKPVPGSQFIVSSIGEDYYLSVDEYTITGLTLGNTILTVSSVEQPKLTATCAITIASAGVSPVILQLVGDESIRWGRTRTYTVFYNSGGTPVEIDATFTLINNEENLVSFVSQDSASCSIIGNVNAKVGDVTLRATTAQGVIEKTIAVVSVW